MISSIVLILFGAIIIKGIIANGFSAAVDIESASLLSSFLSVFILTISNPMTIVFFTGLFTAKAVEYNYTKRDLYLFGFAVGSATFTFMGSSVIVFSLLKGTIPIVIIQILNLLVGVVLIGYGTMRLIKILKTKKSNL